MSVPGGPRGSRERPAHPGQIGIGKAGAGQVRAGEIVQGTVRERLRQSFRRRDAETAGQARRADPVQGTGVLKRLAEGAADSAAGTEDLLAGGAAAEAEGQGTGAAEAGAGAVGELAGQFEVVVTGPSQAQAGIRSKDAVDGLGERMGEIDSSVEAAGEGPGRVMLPGLTGDQSGDGAA
jgi:hypothetical protein